MLPLKLMHVFIDFSLLNLSFLSCHGVLLGGARRGGVLFFNTVVRTRTGGMQVVRNH